MSREITLREAIVWAASRIVVEGEGTESVTFNDGSQITVHSEWTTYGEETGSSADPPSITLWEAPLGNSESR